MSTSENVTVCAPEKCAAHTPGPWRAVGASSDMRHIRLIVDDDANIIAEVRSHWAGQTQANSLANARLIECAPELLAALDTIWRDCMAARMVPDKGSAAAKYAAALRTLERIEKLSTAAVNGARGL